jgi:hypothetical protein
LALCGTHFRSSTQLAYFGAQIQGNAVQIILADCAISLVSVLFYLKLNTLSAHGLAQPNAFFAIANFNIPFAISLIPVLSYPKLNLVSTHPLNANVSLSWGASKGSHPPFDATQYCFVVR